MNNKNKSQLKIEAALLNILREKDFTDITTSEVIERSGYSRRTFYVNYRNIDDLVQKMFTAEVENYTQIIFDSIGNEIDVKKSSNIKDIYLPAYNLFEHVKQNQYFYQLLFEEKLPLVNTDLFVKKTYSRFKERFELKFASDSAIRALSQEELDFFFYVETWNYFIYIRYWYLHNFEPSVSTMAQSVNYFMQLNTIDSIKSK